VWRLDRLGRSLKDLIQLTETLKERVIGLNSLQEAIKTTSSSGQLVFHLFGALAEFERNLLQVATPRYSPSLAYIIYQRLESRSGTHPS
jgi:DNA invertase Pin-like site-specific DNA recombinase